MVYFRIEDIANCEGIQRNYQIEKDKLPIMNKQNVEYYIAEEIRKEVNGAKDRKLLSYSKSLGVCLLKYNAFLDNELHICNVHDMWYENSIYYFSPNQHIKHKFYSLQDALYSRDLFNGNDEITLINFVLDIANNKLLSDYLFKFTNTKLKPYASPEKDYEVIMMQACDDVTINIYIDSIYLLYALQLKYNFLRSPDIVKLLICEIYDLENFRFNNCEHEREAIIFLIQYLYSETEFEKIAFEEMMKYSEQRNIFYGYYHSLLQRQGVMYDSLEDTYYLLNDYIDDVVSSLFWKYCMIYGKNLRQHRRWEEY